MTKWRRLVAVLIAALVLAAVGWQLYATREPSYQGKTLSEWLNEVHQAQDIHPADDSQALAAVRAIGTNGLPTLLRMLQAHDPALKLKLLDWAQKQSFMSFCFRPTYLSQHMARTGFRTLGVEGKDAIPALAALLSDTNCSFNAALCLAAVGAEAIPILRNGLTNGQDSVRFSCLAGLIWAGTNGVAALPEVLSCLHDVNWNVRFQAVSCLRNFQHEAATVLPALWQSAQQEPVPAVRDRSIWAMGCFSNRASAYVPGLQRMLLRPHENGTQRNMTLANALKKIDPTAWPNGSGSPPADAPKDVP